MTKEIMAVLTLLSLFGVVFVALSAYLLWPLRDKFPPARVYGIFLTGVAVNQVCAIMALIHRLSGARPTSFWSSSLWVVGGSIQAIGALLLVRYLLGTRRHDD